MKKIILSAALLFTIGLSSCGNKKSDDQIAEQSAQIEELEKKVDTLESVASESSDIATQRQEDFEATDFDFKNETVGINILETGFGSDEHSSLFFIEYTAVNNSSDTWEAQQLFFKYIDAYQNDELLVFGTVSDSYKFFFDLAHQLPNEIEPGAEAHAAFIYRFTDANSPIELRFYENDNHDVDPIKILKFEMK